jgi:enduracididine biosynthesis enzyme MppP
VLDEEAHVINLSGPSGPASPALGNLTELERSAIVSGANLADGHARYGLTLAQQKIINRLPELFVQAGEAPEASLDREAQVAFLAALGQHAAIARSEVLSCYSSSVALEILGRALYADGIRTVAVLHPTFDNIPDILRGIGLHAVPIEEQQLQDGVLQLPAGVEALFLTTPNNPTGQVLSAHQLEHWAGVCARRGVILVLDTSFRGFDPRAQYDHVEVLVRAGCRYVVIEDTGKLWPTLDLKVGLLVFDMADRLPLHRIYTDILLRVSPLIMLLVQQFSQDAESGGFGELHRLIADNRRLLERGLEGVTQLADADSRISVSRVLLPAGESASRVWSQLHARGVHVLPCGPFHWADPRQGERYLRVALSREPAAVIGAANAIREQLRRG